MLLIAYDFSAHVPVKYKSVSLIPVKRRALATF
jgi:hypothetical protein